jgi:hypothetical protein
LLLVEHLFVSVFHSAFFRGGQKGGRALREEEKIEANAFGSGKITEINQQRGKKGEKAE